MDNFIQVAAMHQKFGLPMPMTPRSLTTEELMGRVEMMTEELVELMRAHRNNDLAEEADALVDLVVFAMGTAVMMGLPWNAMFSEVQRANMSKELGVGKRKNKLDLIKPLGWRPPDIAGILLARIKDGG